MNNEDNICLGDILVSRQKIKNGENLVGFVEAIEEKPSKLFRVRLIDKRRDMVYTIPYHEIGRTWDLVT